VNHGTLTEMMRLAETYATSPIAPIPTLGVRGLTGEANPNVAPSTHRSNPALDQEILKAVEMLERAMKSARANLGHIFNQMRDHQDKNPTHDRLQMLLVVIQQTYETCQSVEELARTDLRNPR